MNVPPIDSSIQSYFCQPRVTRFDRLKSTCSMTDLSRLERLHLVLNSRRSFDEKISASVEFLMHLVQEKDLSERHLYRTFEYLVEQIPAHEMTLEFRAKIVSCIFLFSHRYFKDEIDCEIFEEMAVEFGKFLNINHDRDCWEKAIAEAIHLINENHHSDLDTLLILLQIGVQLIFHSRKENREIWDGGPKKLVKDGIEKRLTFNIAERMPQQIIALGFLQVYISTHQVMVYTPRDITILLKVMVSCNCSVYSIINIKHIVLIGVDEQAPAQYQFFYACLAALGHAKYTSLSDLEFTLSLIHKEFNHLKTNFETQIKVLESIRDVMMNCERLDSPFKVEDIESAFKEFAVVFNIHGEWVTAAQQIIKEIGRSFAKCGTKQYDKLMLCIRIFAQSLFGQEAPNVSKTNFCISCLCVKAAMDISGAHLKVGQLHDTFNHRLIVRLIEESLCCLETNAQQTSMLQMIVANPRLNVEGCLSILELLTESKKQTAQSCIFIGLQNIGTQKEISLTQYSRLVNLLLHPNLIPKETGGLKSADVTKKSLMNFAILNCLHLKWEFDCASYLYDQRRSDGKKLVVEPLSDLYFGDLRKKIKLLSEAYDLKLNHPLIVANWMESIVDKIIEMKDFRNRIQLKVQKSKSMMFLHPHLFGLKRELLNLLYEFCKLIESSRNMLAIEGNDKDDNCIEHFYVRPECALSRLLGFKIEPASNHETEVVLISGEFFLANNGIGIPLLKIKDREEI